MPSTNPFATIESAQEFVSLLVEAAAEARRDLETDASSAQSSRHARALELAMYKLDQLHIALGRSQRCLNDLRTIRRLLNEERAVEASGGR